MPKTYEDITLIDYILKYKPSKNKSHLLLNNYNITNVQELIDYLTDNPENYTPEFTKILKVAALTLDYINHNENPSQIYEITPPLTNKEFLEFSTACDKTTSGDNLAMFPLNSNDYLQTSLKAFNLASIKYLLNHYTFKGNNALIASIESLGPKKIIKLIETIEFYDKQVLRLYQENNAITDNIFYRDRQKKLTIIKAELTTIVTYLFKNDNFIWGTLSPRQKEEILMAISRNRHDKNKALINLVKILTDYTTLSELEDKTNNKCLNRFLKK